MEKNKMNYLVIVLAVCVVLAGVGGFYLGMHFTEKDEVKEDTQVEEPKKEDKIDLNELAKSILKRLEDLYNADIYKTLENDYIAVGEDSKCDYGIGCIRITNFDDVTKNMFTDKGLDKFKELGVFGGITFIDGNAYLIDGFNDDAINLNNAKLDIKENEDEITVKFVAPQNNLEEGTVGISHNVYGTVTLVKNNNSYLIDDLEFDEAV